MNVTSISGQDDSTNADFDSESLEEKGKAKQGTHFLIDYYVL